VVVYDDYYIIATDMPKYAVIPDVTVFFFIDMFTEELSFKINLKYKRDTMYLIMSEYPRDLRLF